MKLTQAQRKFNSPGSLLVVSAYPAKHTTHNGGGLASYTKNTVKAVKKAFPKARIVVLANIIDAPEVYLDNGVLVVRCWERSFLKLYPTLMSNVLRFNRIKKVLFGFEFAAYGDIVTTAAIPVFLGLLSLLGKRVVTVIHQVTLHLSDLAVHTGLSKNPSSIPFYNSALRTFYLFLGLGSSKVVTLEKELTDRFNSIVPGKAVTIAHGLRRRHPFKRNQALKKLNLDPSHYYVLAFGYLSHYKGSDLLVKAFEQPLEVNGKKVRLILAGGENPTQGQKHHYRHFYEKLYKHIDDNPAIIHTGFVPDHRIKTYFSAADLVIFPYRAFMSASGPLSLALGFAKPILVSNKLKDYSPYTFTPTSRAIRESIVNALENKGNIKLMTQLSREISRDRDFSLQGEQYLHLFTKETAATPRLAAQ